MAQQQGFLGLMDMFDGGGAGASGSQFKGGPVSGLLNSVGVNPYGTQAKMQGMQETRPQARPQMPGQTPQAPQQATQGPPAMPQQPMQYGPQNGRGAAGPAPVGQSGPQPMPTDQQRMQYGPQQPMQYSGRGQTGMPLPPEAQNLTPQQMEILQFLRSTQDSPY